MNHARYMTKPASSERIARVLFCTYDDCLVALHGFVKKTQKTPDADLKLARKRMKEVAP